MKNEYDSLSGLERELEMELESYSEDEEYEFEYEYDDEDGEEEYEYYGGEDELEMEFESLMDDIDEDEEYEFEYEFELEDSIGQYADRFYELSMQEFESESSLDGQLNRLLDPALDNEQFHTLYREFTVQPEKVEAFGQMLPNPKLMTR